MISFWSHSYHHDPIEYTSALVAIADVKRLYALRTTLGQ